MTSAFVVSSDNFLPEIHWWYRVPCLLVKALQESWNSRVNANPRSPFSDCMVGIETVRVTP